MAKTIAGTEAPTLGDLKTSEGRGNLGKLASAAFVVTVVAVPVIGAGLAAGAWVKAKLESGAQGITEAFRGI